MRAVGGAALGLGCFEFWREREKARLYGLAMTLSSHGFVKVKGIASSVKETAWREYEPLLEAKWIRERCKERRKVDDEKGQKSSFNINNPVTWPHSESGRYKSYGHHGAASGRLDSVGRSLDYPVRLWDDNYEAQAVVAVFVGGTLDGRVHWGDRTHWKLRLLMFRPWNAVASLFKNTDCIRGVDDLDVAESKSEYQKQDYSNESEVELILDGENNGWGITIFPTTKKEQGGKPTLKHAHIDGGRNSIFQKDGFPFRGKPGAVESYCDCDEAENMRLDVELMQLVAAQAAIQIVCCTPGKLDAAKGVTGIYEGSNLILVAALRDALCRARRRQRNESKKNVTSCRATISYRAVKAALVNATEGPGSESRAISELLRQVTIEDDEVIIMTGSTVHGAMFSSEPMLVRQLPSSDTLSPRPRVIMNPKVFLKSSGKAARDGEGARTLAAFAASSECMPRSMSLSPSRRMIMEPRSLWVQHGLGSADEFDQKVAMLSKDMYLD